MGTVSISQKLHRLPSFKQRWAYPQSIFEKDLGPKKGLPTTLSSLRAHIRITEKFILDKMAHYLKVPASPWSSFHNYFEIRKRQQIFADFKQSFKKLSQAKVHLKTRNNTKAQALERQAFSKAVALAQGLTEYYGAKNRQGMAISRFIKMAGGSLFVVGVTGGLLAWAAPGYAALATGGFGKGLLGWGTLTGGTAAGYTWINAGKRSFFHALGDTESPSDPQRIARDFRLGLQFGSLGAVGTTLGLAGRDGLLWSSANFAGHGAAHTYGEGGIPSQILGAAAVGAATPLFFRALETVPPWSKGLIKKINKPGTEPALKKPSPPSKNPEVEIHIEPKGKAELKPPEAVNPFVAKDPKNWDWVSKTRQVPKRSAEIPQAVQKQIDAIIDLSDGSGFEYGFVTIQVGKKLIRWRVKDENQYITSYEERSIGPKAYRENVGYLLGKTRFLLAPLRSQAVRIYSFHTHPKRNVPPNSLIQTPIYSHGDGGVYTHINQADCRAAEELLKLMGSFLRDYNYTGPIEVLGAAVPARTGASKGDLYLASYCQCYD